ncbi:DUF6880 family protein [Roseateles sp.]|uniref:DUF6880 family protein n=1 Tax=Roseateles sp. TaxID=1971397 RepID=UPI003BAA0584
MRWVRFRRKSTARLLIELLRKTDAEAVLVDKAAAIDGADYVALRPLATALAEQGSRKGATAIYRALLLNILERANARAYGHAARYLQSLELLGSEDLAPLQPHGNFVAHLRSKHGRKTAFWSLVGGA